MLQQNTDDRSIGELFADLTREVSTLVREEVNLAKVEITQKATSSVKNIAFIAVGACLLVMRRRAPEIKRPFRTPLGVLVGLGAILGCLYLFASLPTKTILWCLLWNAIGIGIYVLYGRAHSILGKTAP